MSDLGECTYYLGMNIRRDRRNRLLALSQEGYLHRILADAGMRDCKPVTTPMDCNLKLEPSDKTFTAGKEVCIAMQKLLAR